MRELVSKVIDGRTYDFQQFNTTTALKNFSVLTQLLGEPLVMALATYFKNRTKSGKKSLESLLKTDVAEIVDYDALPKVATALIGRLEDDGTDRAVKLIQALTSGPGVLCDNNPVIFDAHYEGDLAHLCRVLAAAIGVQYGNFLNAAAAKAPARPAATQPVVAVR